MIFDYSVNESKRLLKKYADVWDGIKNEIIVINGGEGNNYGKDYIKIKFNSDDDLSLNKPLKFYAMAITTRTHGKNLVSWKILIKSIIAQIIMMLVSSFRFWENRVGLMK